MKSLASIIFLLVLLIFMTLSCKKELFPSTTKDITGQWVWILSYSGGNPTIQPNPITPQNTGIQEIVRFNSNDTWLKIQNNVHIDSGTFTKGHGSYTPYIGAFTYSYDSIVYFRNGISEKGTQDYYKIFNDTLEFCAGFAGYATKSDPTAGDSEFYVKQK